MAVYRIPDKELVFPNPALADRDADSNGLLGVGGDLRPARLLLAYRSGIFPWYSNGGPILWWSPDPRFVIYPDRMHVSRSLARTIRRGQFAVTMDRAFADVIEGCATTPRRGQGGTWITPEMGAAYTLLHEQGHAHSVEAWAGNRLAGGVYGVSIGRFFAAESMFAAAPDASKAALVHLVRQLARWGFPLIDSQIHTDHVARMGGMDIPRRRYLAELKAAAALPPPPLPWRFDTDFDPLG
ncbi:MAG: Leucyl/phenylalanyl-tRNA--protein transferase [Phycisphaerae bacterium]|nr:Leucyl/phenylalanyl-tRNA--protein transferase [Phycisphaerae bacterium]